MLIFFLLQKFMLIIKREFNLIDILVRQYI